MKLLISGSSGLVGTALMKQLSAEGHQFRRLVRGPADNKQTFHWDPASGKMDPNALEGMDAVVNLSGENLASGRWTFAKKKRIRESRVFSTALLAKTMAKMKQPPALLINASAIGYYGTGGDEWFDESSPAGKGFLAEVCKQWEEAANEARQAGIRVVQMRFGVILSKDGGALKKMVLPFKLGLGGKVGSGSQFMSWVAIDDVIGAIEFSVKNESINGPVNVVAPNPVTNTQFTSALARAVKRPAFLPLPSLPLKAAFGEMADAMLLSGVRVKPQKLLDAGFEYKDTEIESALKRLVR